MVEAVAEKQVCEECGVDVRENTAFCYNCGSSVGEVLASNDVAAENSDETKAALDDLAKRFKIDEEEDDRLAKAAAERRKARVSNRKSLKYEWQPTDDSPDFLFIGLTIVIAVVAGLAVILTAVWK